MKNTHINLGGSRHTSTPEGRQHARPTHINPGDPTPERADGGADGRADGEPTRRGPRQRGRPGTHINAGGPDRRRDRHTATPEGAAGPRQRGPTHQPRTGPTQPRRGPTGGGRQREADTEGTHWADTEFKVRRARSGATLWSRSASQEYDPKYPQRFSSARGRARGR